jgi:hypothetical protein
MSAYPEQHKRETAQTGGAIFLFLFHDAAPDDCFFDMIRDSSVSLNHTTKTPWISFHFDA